MNNEHLIEYIKCRSVCAEECEQSPFKELFAQTLVRHGQLRELIDEFKEQPEFELLSMGVSKFGHSLIQCQIGQYEYSMISLRQAIEVFLNGLFFSLNEILLLNWLDAKGDLLWARIIDENTGIFSKATITTLCEALQDEADSYHSIAKSLYRETSSYVHLSKNADKPHLSSHSEDRIHDWFGKFQNATYLLASIWYTRYSRRIDASMNARIVDHLTDICGMYSAVYKYATTRNFNHA